MTVAVYSNFLYYRHRFVTGHVYNFPSGILSTGGTGTVCSTLTVSTNFQFRIQEGDVYAVSLSSDSNSLPILASLPASSGRRLYVDTRIEANQQNIFRLSDLNAVGNVGMHLSADISEFLMLGYCLMTGTFLMMYRDHLTYNTLYM